ncbi:homoserine kinase [Mumia flava]|uniref:Homoserine kinase n=1 Tax=Mumia flava TaxID=1348852 RepID=A0A0B2BSL0_9ACTN|nr:homoserine kinase [Mumia flava]PJJ56463.1 homoserine kinase [Mumia flava]
MSAFVTGPRTVVVPASSANLGPGFDALGLALTLYDEIELEVRDRPGVEVEVEGMGADEVPRDESHLVVRSARAAFAACGLEQPGLRLRCTNRIPHARGLGSSSAAIVGGIVAARSVLADPAALDDAAALRLADRIEGHPDNVAAALLGGLTIAWGAADGARAIRLPVEADVVVYVPPTPVRTDVARGLIPAGIPHEDAAHAAGRAALLVAALQGHGDALLDATEDRLHQGFRAPAMPDSLALIERLRADGVPAVVSGAGPTVLAFCTAEHPAAPLAACVPDGWAVHLLAVDTGGARPS